MSSDDNRRHAAGPVVVLTQILTRGLEIHQQRNVAPKLLPVIDRQRHADVPRQGIEMDRRVGRAADGAC